MLCQLTIMKRLLAPASLELIKPVLPRTNPKDQMQGGASLLPSWTQNPSDRKISVVISRLSMVDEISVNAHDRINERY